MRRAAACAAAAALLLVPLGAGAAIDPSCWFSTNGHVEHWPSGTIIPIYVSLSSAHGVETAGYDATAVMEAVQIALARWNEDAGAQIRFAPVTWTYVDENPGAVVVQGSSGCSAHAAFAWPNTSNVGVIDSGGVTLNQYGLLAGTSTCDFNNPYAASFGGDPSTLVDVLTHELGHTLGRADAYGDGTSTPQCGLDHPTIMSEMYQDLTDFDKAETQAMYGARYGSLRRRTITGGGYAWGPVNSFGAASWLVRPGPGSSFGSDIVPVTLVQLLADNTTRMLQFLFKHDETWSFQTASVLPDGALPRNPAAVAFAPDGVGMMAYIYMDSSWTRRACYRFTSDHGASYGAETCISSSTCYPYRNGVGAAYDPRSSRFMLAWSCLDSVGLAAVPRPATGKASIIRTLPNHTIGDAPAITCADTQPIDAPLYSNCLLAYAARSTPRQNLEWFQFGVGPQNSLWIGTTRQSANATEHAPALAWFAGEYHLAISYWDSTLYHFTMPRVGTAWTYQSAPAFGGHTSPPYLVTTQQCLLGVCTNKLHLFWLSYP